MTRTKNPPTAVARQDTEVPTHVFDVDPDGYRTYFEDDYWRLADFSCSSAGVIDTELSFLSERLDAWNAASVLDVGCGRGRHLVPLARAGYDVTGVDVSRRNIDLTRQAISDNDVAAHVMHGDARDLELDRRFDVALFMLSSFGYHCDAENLRLLQTIRRHMTDEGHIVLDQPNREQLVTNFLTRSWAEVGGHYYLMHYSLDLDSGTRDGWLNVFNPGGSMRSYFNRFRLYTTAEMRQLLHTAGFEVEAVIGDFTSVLTRGDTTSRRLQYIARAI
ncbi:class I SAM-dependent methyltransferase [Streptomyces griseoluteus]|uniref:class I SAM-dependent methyltransferase n=1 Tax=Streptomyces griseoluteus TaxID=29306 RepID=UPI0036FA24A1